MRGRYDAEASAEGLKSDSPATRRCALIALDQMAGGKLGVTSVAPLLTSADARLKATASWIAGHHPEWGEALAASFRERLAGRELDRGDREGLAHLLAQLARNFGVPRP